MKKLLTAIMLCYAVHAMAHDFTAVSAGSVVYYKKTSENTVEVTGDASAKLYNSYAGDVTIPAVVNDGGIEYRVTGVGDNAFAYSNELTSVRLPQSVEYIGKRAFAGCVAMRDISLASGLKSISANAFAWCDALEKVHIPASVSMIAPGAFEGCQSLQEIEVSPGGAYSSVDGVLMDAAATTIVVYPAGKTEACAVPLAVTAVADGAFYGCSRVPEVKLPEGLERIGDNAFYFCGELESVTVPASVSEIGRDAFADCYSLSSINVSPGNNVYSSSDGLLLSADGSRLLQSPAGRCSHDSLPRSVTEIADMAFFRNYGLKHISVTPGVTTLGMGAYMDCANALSVHLPSTITGIGDYAFAFCASLEHVYIDVEDPSTLDLGEDMFANVPLDKCVLYVPRVGLTNYLGKMPWCYFALVEGYDKLMEQHIVWEQDLKPEWGSSGRLYAKATSGLPVSYAVAASSKAYAHIYADKITFTDPGDLVVTAYQQGSHEYAPAQPVTRMIHVSGDAGIDDVLADGASISVYGLEGRIKVKGAPEGTKVRVYAIGGEEIYSGKDTCISVRGGGVYVVRVGRQAFKVLVK